MRRLLLCLTAATLVAGCTTGSADTGSAGTEGEQLADSAPTVVPAEEQAPVDPASPSSWGPTLGEISQARASVAAMSIEQQAWQVLMPAFWGFDAEAPTPAEAARNVESHGVGSITEAADAHGYGGLFVKPEAIRGRRAGS